VDAVKRPLTPSALDSIAGIQALTLSPDGMWLAWRERGALWLLSTTAGGVPQRLANGFAPAWDPTGEALAYFAPSTTGRDLQVFTYDLASRRSTQVTQQPGGAYGDQIDWSRSDKLVFVARAPDDGAEWTPPGRAPEPASAELGRPLVLLTDTPDGFALTGLVRGTPPPSARPPGASAELFVHDLGSGTTRQLTHLGQGLHGARWSPDGRTIVAGSQRAMGAATLGAALYLIDATSGTATELAPAATSNKISPLWSPDGRRISYIVVDASGGRAEHGVAVIEVGPNRTTGAPTMVRAGMVSAIAWTGDGDGLLVAAIEGVSRPLEHLDLRTRARTPVSGADRVVGSPSAASRSGTSAWVESSGRVPGLIMLRRTGTTAAVALHDPNPQLRERLLGEQRVVRWRNQHGHDRAGVLILPPGRAPGQRHPLIVSAYTQSSHLNEFQGSTDPGFASQLHASRGYAVFYPGPRVPWNHLSLTQSVDEREALRGADGWKLTIDDVESGVDHLIASGLVDSTRMGVIGFSNGGGVAIALATRVTRYRAIVAIAPAHLDWVQDGMFRDNRDGRWIPPELFLGIDRGIEDDPEPWVRGSPVFQLGRIRTPMLLAVGDDDNAEFTVPTAELYLGLRRLGQDVTFLRYQGTGHGFYGPARADLNGRIDRFLDGLLRP
jgi:dipeptidyl aminopeptidase/acylaminoacyl peptidase